LEEPDADLVLRIGCGYIRRAISINITCDERPDPAVLGDDDRLAELEGSGRGGRQAEDLSCENAPGDLHDPSARRIAGFRDAGNEGERPLRVSGRVWRAIGGDWVGPRSGGRDG
jgi:hypothetical protein